MPPALEDRRPPITPQLAVRVAVLGGIAFVLFGIIFFRLWFLQVLSGDQYLAEARENRVRKERIEAPRGQIVDREGRVLVDSRVAPVVQLEAETVPESIRAQADEHRKAVAAAERERLARGRKRSRAVPVPPFPPEEVALRRRYRRLGKVIGMSTREIHQRAVRELADLPYSNVTLRTDVPRAAYSYLYERKSEFPGIVIDKKYLRHYPYKTLGAHLFGTLREISPEELESEQYRGVEPGERIGKDGVEETYDRYLRGKDGFTRVTIDALGNREPARGRNSRKEPVQGRQLRLTLDLDLQRAGDEAMQRAVQLARANANPAKAGAFVALDPRDGAVLALGSFPSFDANLLARPFSQKVADELYSEEAGAPLVNRAIASIQPVGSTFKPITALAALRSGLIEPSTPIYDDGTFEYGNQEFKNAKDAVFGSVDLARALQVSSDFYFYRLGAQANAQGRIIQTMARQMGLDSPTGIDLPGEFGGLVPDRKWRDAQYAKWLKCQQDDPPKDVIFPCGIYNTPWVGGFNVQLAIGQGDLQATPLQMAVAYAGLVEGRVPTPYLGDQVEDSAGRPIERIRHERPARLKVAEEHRRAVLEGLRRAAMEPDGTSYDIFRSLGGGVTVYGKTGTVERQGKPDDSWYVAYATDPQNTRPIVVAVMVESGGFGAQAAAPAARYMLGQWFGLRKEFRAGESQL